MAGWIALGVLLTTAFFGLLVLRRWLRWKEKIQKQTFYYQSQLLEQEELFRYADDHVEEILGKETGLKEMARKNLDDLDLLGVRIFYPESFREVVEGATQPLQEIQMAKKMVAREGRHQRALRRVAEEAAIMRAKQEALKELEAMKSPRRRRIYEQFSGDLESRD